MPQTGVLLASPVSEINLDKKTDLDGTIQVSGIEFKPSFFQINDSFTGIDYEIASQVLTDAGIIVEPVIKNSWTAAYEQTQKGENRALLSVAYTEKRKDDFKWVGPTSKAVYCIHAKSESGIEMGIDIEGSKLLQSIAVVTGWLEATLLEDLDFSNLVYFDSYKEAFEAFMNDDVQAFASDGFQLAYEMGAGNYANLIIAARYHTAFYYIGFSKDVDDAIIEKCQEALNNMIKSGASFEIIKKYFPYVNRMNTPGIIQLFSHVAPPLNYFIGDNFNVEVKGSSTEFVNAIQNRIGYVDNINIGSWVYAYQTVQYLPNSAIFTTARTPAREDLFQWVGPVSPLKTSFYTLSESGIQIETLDQAKKLGSIGTALGWYSHDYLIKNGFQNINATAITAEDAFNQLINGEVEALLMYDLGVNWLCTQSEISQESLSKQLEVSNHEGYIAFSLTTPSETVQLWQSTLDAMKADGSYDTIWNKWYR
jgi:polar amino acid transport system substrate-binding protein